MATRLAVGAGRGRLIAQLLTETLVLYIVAAAVSVPLTMWLVSLLNGSLPALPFAINLNFAVNVRVMAFAFSIALVTGIIFGLAPARHALASDLAPMLHGANATADRKRFRLRNSLVAAQVALSLMLVVASWAGPVPAIEVTRAPPPRVADFAQWTRVGAVTSGGTSPFNADVSVWCKVEAGCEMRDSRGHSAPVAVSATDTGLIFSPRDSVVYKPLGPGNTRWSLVLSLGNKEWSDDWLAPVRTW